MKIFIIGENHVADIRQHISLIKHLDYKKVFLSAEPYIYPVVKKEHLGIKNITLYGMEDYAIRFYVEVLNIYYNLADYCIIKNTDRIVNEKPLDLIDLIENKIANSIYEIAFDFNDLSIMHDRDKDFDGFSYYKDTYGKNFFDSIRHLKEDLMLLLAGGNNPDIKSLEEKNIVTNELSCNVLALTSKKFETIEILKKVSDIIDKSGNLNSLQKKYIGEEFIDQLTNSTGWEKCELVMAATGRLRDKPLAENIERYIKDSKFSNKDAFIFIVGTRHLFGLSQELSEKHFPVKIEYCFGYNDFNRQYRKHTDEIALWNMRNKMEILKYPYVKLKETQKMVTHFFKPQTDKQPRDKEKESFPAASEYPSTT